MAYIEFTSPEGKTYQIEINEENPIIYECPDCGEITLFVFDPTENYCNPCSSRQAEMWKMNYLRLMEMANRLNKKYDLTLTANDLEELENSPEYKKNPTQVLEDYIDKQVEKRIKERRQNGEIHPKVTIIHKGKAL